MRHLAFLLSAIAAMGSIQAQENYVSSWTGHKNVILNTNTVQGGAGVTGNVYNFPVLVRLGTADSLIFNQSKAGGADLRFTKANNTTRLPHQIESWNAAGRSAAVWVLVDTVRGMRNNQYIRMHWGNSAANDSSSGTQTFRTAHGFQAVWHMNGASATSNESDATANALTATQNSSPATATGMIAGARNIANSGTTVTQYFNVANSASPLNFAEMGNYTISAWVNLNSVANHATVVSKHDLAYALKTNQSGTWEFFEFSGGSWNAVNGNGAETGTWQLLMGVQNGGDMAFYQNGQRVDGGVINTSGGGSHSMDQDMLIGAEPQTATTRRRPLDGIVDEVRIASASRNADWAKLEYENQKPGQSLVRLLDTVPPLSISPARGFGAAGFTMLASGGGAVFRVVDPRAASLRLEVMDLQGRSVWSYRGAAADPVAWDGVNLSGKRAAQGLYMVRVDLFDASGAKAGTLERRLPLTR
jgi:hypothetical protein